MYDISNARWMSRDPLGLNGGQTNMYSYVSGNPVNTIDPSGLVGFTRPLPGGGKLGVNYGPWRCRTDQIEECKTECKKEGGTFKGCVWVADFQIQFGNPAQSVLGTFAGFKHCCCDKPQLPPDEVAKLRRKWDAYRDKFREQLDKQWGKYPCGTDKKPFPVHHVDPLAEGGDPTANTNLLPAPPDVHKEFHKAYRECTAGTFGWDKPGPPWPYTPFPY